jgi:uncharacterized protein YegL
MKTLAKTTLGVACSVFVTLTACGNADVDGSDFDRGGDTDGFGGGGESVGGNGDLPNGPAGEPDLEACATHTASAEARPVYLVVTYDRSGSMRGTRWTACKSAMRAFFESSTSQGMHASLSFFPQGNSCDVSNYAQPAVAMSPLPSATFGQQLDQTSPNGGTPTRPALEGAMQYADAVAQGDGKDGKVVVVLVTDGAPNDCSSSVNNVSAIAANASSKYPTYVVGVGNVSNMDTIAKAGGTDKAFVVSTNDPTQTQDDLLKAMEEIRLSALSCDYKIPDPPPGEELDKDKVNVVYAPEGKKEETLSYNPSCKGGTGWRYDDASRPTRILMCDSTCETLKAVPGKVDVAFGCATKGGQVN